MSIKKTAIVGICIAILSYLTYLFFHAQSTETSASHTESTPTSETSTLTTPSSSAEASADLPTDALPTSHEGTEVDGGVTVNAQGALVVDNALKRLFDYFITMTGARSDNFIDKALTSHLRDHLKLSPQLQSQILDLFGRYRKYALASLTLVQAKQEQSSTEQVNQLKQQQRDLRRQFFSPAEAQGLFGQDDLYDEYYMQMENIYANGSLSATEKERLIKEAAKKLPAGYQRYLNQQYTYDQLERLTEQMQKDGATAAELYQMRSNLVGPQAAMRLAALDDERAAWQKRIDAFLQQKAAILANTQLNTTTQQQQIEVLRQQLFNEQERKRLLAYE